MTAFSSEVYKNTAEQPTSDLTDYTDYLKKRAKAAQKWEGSATGYVPQTSLADDLAAQDAYKSGEYNRRTGAAEQEMGLAKAEDTRTASVADRVKQALYDRTQAEQATDTKSLQLSRTGAQDTAGQYQGYEQAVKKLNFTAYTNAADRYDALKDANDKGILEYTILQANRDGALTIADLDRVFAIQKNELENKFKAVQAMSDMDLKVFIAELTANSANINTTIDGLFSGVATFVEDFFS